MSFVDTRFARSVSCVMALSITNMSVPYYVFARSESAPPPPVISQERRSRLLSDKELRSISGSTAENPYISGSQKWDVSYKGVSLLTGNFSTSATDLSFEGGYGIPVNLTRSYSANNPDEGPMGQGWTLSVDIRTTAGGLLKSSGAPIRSVPVNYRERPTQQLDDPGTASANQPVEAVVATDASGDEETIQRDVDGVLTTPPWDKNATVTEYELVVDPFNGTDPEKRYSIAKKITTTTPDGTVYVYEKKGAYPDGAVPYNQPSVDPEPTNVLKPTTVTDRHGNVTTYTYDTGTGSTHQATLAKYNGTSVEQKLLSIEMPGDREIEFEWGTSSLSNRIVSATASTGSASRVVEYEYSTGSYHQLTKATTPAGRFTAYGYGDVDGESIATSSLLKSIEDQRGLETTIHYVLADIATMPFGPYTEETASGVFCYKIVHPNLNVTRFIADGAAWPSGEPDDDFMRGSTPVPAQIAFADLPDDSADTLDDASCQGIVTAVFIYDSNPNLFKFRTQIEPYGVLGPPTAGGAIVEKTYLVSTQDLTQEIHRTGPNAIHHDLHAARNLENHGSYIHKVQTESTYNFLGNPLSRTVTPYVGSTSGTSLTTEFAYWGATKYYQQKGTKDPAGRYSMTDYWDTSATDGRRGQVRYVYDPKYGSFSGTGSGWQTSLSAGGPDSAHFDYDSVGRPTDVYKLKSTGTPATYIHTLTSYGQLGSTPTGGNASQVIEDEGSGKINRTTQTIEFDEAGRAVTVHDPTGKYWVTTLDDDGQVTSVDFYIGSTWYGVTQYTYGTSGVEKGVVTGVLDQLGSITQTFSYAPSGSGIGQVQSIVEDNDSNYDYTVSYEFNTFGERASATYETPTGGGTETVKWKYSDYQQVGDPTQGSRVFQTLNKQQYVSSAWIDSNEEFHYQFDSSGRLREAAFAQTPQTSQTYSSATAELRARALYEYDPFGKLWNLEYTWDDWNGSAYDSTKIVRNGCDYATYTQLKTESDYYVNNGSNAWTTTGGRVEKYAYDADLDYLTGATYNGSTPGTDWTYDPTGNRNISGYTYDNLNRMTASPKSGGSYSYTNDILGNRTWRDPGTNVSTSQRYTWDEVGRLFSFCTPSSGAKYIYRADGMRVEKIEGLSLNWVPPSSEEEDSESSGYYDAIWATNKPTTRYFYDGQMAMGEDYTNSSTYTTTKYGIGARGIDYIEHYNGSSTIVGFPIYDAHGNMVLTLSRSGSSFATGDQKYYDAWGAQNGGSGSSSGIPKQRYCANLGHVQDDESGLIYMRARYYEPTTGRFVSEDKARDNTNYYVYAADDPTNQADASGTTNEPLNFLGNALLAFGWFVFKNGCSPFQDFWAWAERKGYSIASEETLKAIGLDKNMAKLIVSLVNIGLQRNSPNLKASITQRWTGYAIMILGQILMDIAESDTPGGGDWWAYDAITKGIIR